MPRPVPLTTFLPGLCLYPPFQRNGTLDLRPDAARAALGRRHAPDAPLAYLFIEDRDIGPERVHVELGHYLAREQVWEYHPDFGGSSNLVPRNRRISAATPSS